MKEQGNIYDDKAKTLHVEDRMEPIKIHILTPSLDVKEDDCYSKMLTCLKVSVLVVLLLILSWTAVALYSKRCIKEVEMNEKLEQFINIQDDYKTNKNTLLKLNDVTTESIKSVNSLDSADHHKRYKILRNSPHSIILVDDVDEDGLEASKQMIVKREVNDPAPETSGLKQKSTEQEKHVDYILPGVTLPTLMAKHLEPVVGPNFELLDWYYRCKAHPELEKSKDKLHVSTAKWLFGTDITTFRKDSDTVSSLIMDPAYVLELREIIDKNMTLIPQTPVQRRIVDIIMSKAKLDSEVKKSKTIPSWLSIGLEGLNAETLRNFYFLKKEIADGCKNCSKDEKVHLESLKNLVDRFTSSEESEEKSYAETKPQSTNEAFESLKKLKKVAVEHALE